MFPANHHRIRTATAADEATLTRLGVLSSQQPIELPALIGEVDGIPAAALSLSDGRLTADPYAAPPQLAISLRMRAAGIRAYESTPAVAERIRAAQAGLAKAA